MKKGIILVLGLGFIQCQKENDKCGQIIQKVNREGIYYFVLQTDENVHYYSTPNNFNIPDDGIRQGIVSKETYDSYAVGNNYCTD